MAISNQEAKKMVNTASQKAADRTLKKSDERMQRYIGGLRKESDEKIERYVGAIKEDIDHKFDVIMEILPDIQRKVDVTFDKVGEMVPDVEFNKEVLKDHEARIKVLEKG